MTSRPLNLTDPTNTIITDGQAVATISDDDPPPYLTISNVSTTEGNAGTQGLTFTVRLTAPSGRPITVSYSTTTTAEIIPATADTDFTTTSGTLTLLPGTTTQTITVPIVGDTLYEPNEFFFVQLSEPVNALLSGLGRGKLGTIINDDPPPPLPALLISDHNVTEGDSNSTSVLFNVTLSAPSAQIVTVFYDTFDSTALAGSDYTATSGSLTFLPGQTSQTISVPILDDLAVELKENFSVRLRSPLNATIADVLGFVIVLDNDPPPALSVSDATVIEGDSGSPSALYRDPL